MLMPYENDSAGIALMESNVAIVISYISPFGVWAISTIERKVNAAHSGIDVREVLFHMSDFGWVIFRYDIGVALPDDPHTAVVSFQLTDEGRILKALDDVPTYQEYVGDKMNKEITRQQLSDIL